MRRLALLLAGALILAVAVPGAVAAKAPAASAYTVPITGTFPGGGTAAGTFTITRFAQSGGNLVAVGTLTATLTDALGNVVGTVTQSLTLPVSVAGTTCEVLHLTLGPLDLNLLGLLVHLNQVVLTIDAQSGPGNLLGNLLCAVANLLNGPGPLAGITALLNQILAILSQL